MPINGAEPKLVACKINEGFIFCNCSMKEIKIVSLISNIWEKSVLKKSFNQQQ